MLTKHTQGQWAFSKDATPDYAPQFTIYASDGARVITTHGLEAEANARLCAAAPDLLKALHGLLYCPDLNLDELEEDTRLALTDALNAFASATGG